MSDILKMIENLRESLWARYGNVLLPGRSQDEVHLTYYAGELLRFNGYNHVVIKGQTFYTEKAMHAAFIGGRRVGLQNANTLAQEIVDQRLGAAREALNGDFE